MASTARACAGSASIAPEATRDWYCLRKALGAAEDMGANGPTAREKARCELGGGICGRMSAGARFSFLLPLWEKVARTKSASDEGVLGDGACGYPSPGRAGARPPSPTRGEEERSASLR